MSWPAVDIGANGILGVAVEAADAPGTYVAPTKYFPIMSETLMLDAENIKRRSLRGVADMVGLVPGRTSVKGDVDFELSDDVLPYFMYAMRGTVVKTGSDPNYIYTLTPASGAVPASWSGRTLSITVVRNGICFAYVGCVVSQLDVDATDNNMVTAKATIVGLDEASQDVPTPTYTDIVPMGFGDYNIQIPTDTTVYDMDKFTFTVNDAAVAQWRLQTTRAPSYINFGERTVEYKTERDFLTRDEYDDYYRTALPEDGLTVLLSHGTDNQIEFDLPAPVPDAYNVGSLSGQGTLIRSTMTYDGTYDYDDDYAYQIICKTQEVVTLP